MRIGIHRNNLTELYMKDLKREDIIPVLAEYYKGIGRTTPPQFETYTLQELKKCLTLFKIVLKKE